MSSKLYIVISFTRLCKASPPSQKSNAASVSPDQESFVQKRCLPLFFHTFRQHLHVYILLSLAQIIRGWLEG